jgi:putative transposase
VQRMQTATSISKRRACRLAGISRSTLDYLPRVNPGDQLLTAKIISLAQERRRFGYRRIHALLRREGVSVNHKRVYRLYRLSDLAVRKRKRRKGIMVQREPLERPAKRNEVWSMDFVMDALFNGRRIKILAIVDDCTRELVDLVVDFGISGRYVTRVLDRAARFRGYPKAIRTDQGPEFTSHVMDQWAYDNGVKLKLIQPGKPTQNAYIESFNGKFRDECLNEHWFQSIDHARVIIQDWKTDYNENRPHSMLGYQTPKEAASAKA